MADLFFPEVTPNQRATALGLDIMPATFGEGFGAAFEETLTRNPLPSAIRSIGRARYREGRYVDEFGNEQVAPAVKAPVLSSEEANARYGIKGRLTFEAPTPEPVAEERFRLKQREIELQDIRRRANAGIGTALTAGVVGSLLDPFNIGLALVPVVGPARQAALAARLGVGGGRVATGVIEGAVGAALIEPLVLGVAMEEQADYTAVDSVMNLAFGSVLGGGLHFGAGFIGDRLRARTEAPALPRLIDNLPQQDQAALLRTAVSQILEGRPVDIAPVLERTTAALTRANQIAEAQIRLAEIAQTPAFLRSADDILALRDATATVDAAGKLPPEMKRAVEILRKPGFLRTAEDRIFLAGMRETDDLVPETRAAAEAMLTKIARNEAPGPFAEAAQMAVVRAGKDNVLRKLDEVLQSQEAAAPETRAQVLEKTVRDIAEGVYDQEFAIDTRSVDLQGRAFEALRGERDARLREAVDKAHETYVDPEDARGVAAAEARVAAESKVVDIDDEMTKVQNEVTELESYLPEGTEPSQAVKDAAKEATLYERAWKAAAACVMRKA